ncbi:hypothetical protein pqer_cds_315 [Pandoravirus quercus]|uniref:Uncharacterized protein n=1 Tax=Pandoravirus quercus TaxID=2107709 RepID=A0A2U7U8I1_9VIRU|nr:hypothetical protein pqer_cds_315 [Pandoravirus quercus]AVK74737.1 hypothetical protein pqer_cds_315 [Pandoravirus quercus]
MHAASKTQSPDDDAMSLLLFLLAPLVMAALARVFVRIYARYAKEARTRPTPRPTPYHLSIAIDSLADLAAGGWSVRVAETHPILSAVHKRLTPSSDPDQDDHVRDHMTETAATLDGTGTDGRPHDRGHIDRHGAAATAIGDESLVKTVGFLGARGAGKTFCINSLYGLTLPCGPLHPTRGLGLVWPTAPGKPAIVDTAGDRAPTLAGDATAAHDRRLTETLIEDVALHCVDQLVLVVGDMTAADQARIASLAERVAHRGQRQLFVLHNLRHAADPHECDRLWEDQVLTPYAAVGHLEHRGDRRLAHFVTTVGSVHVYHMRLACTGTPAGDMINAHTYAMLRARLDAFGVARPFDPCALIDQSLGDALPCLVSDFAGIEWHPEGALAGDAFGDDDGLVARIQCRMHGAGAMRAAPLRLRPVPLRMAMAGDAVAVDTMDGSDFDVPVEVRDMGAYTAVRIDVPGVDPASLTVTSLVGPRGQYAEVRGLRLLPPDDDDGTHHNNDCTVAGRGGGYNNDNNGNENKHARGDPETDDRCRPMPWPRGKKSDRVPRSVVDSRERSGRLCVRVDMPPGSRVDASTIDCTYGVLSFKIRRQTQPIPLPVQKAPSAPAGL